MKFGNVALYCKGWYKYREGSIKNMWMDLLHCINADGWSLWSKEDVVTWCIHRMDDMRKDENFPHKYQLDISYFWEEINKIKHRNDWISKDLISYEDAIIMHYHNIISCLPKECFTEGFIKPNEHILPLQYNTAYVDDGRYSKNPSWDHADMHCDVIEKINKMFPDYKEQEIEDDEFERQEAWIRGKKWEDIVVLIGSDNLNDCEEVILSGEFLNNTHNKHYKDDDFLDLNIYEHTINFNDKSHYRCRVKKEIEHWNWGDDINYKLMSVLSYA